MDPAKAADFQRLLSVAIPVEADKAEKAALSYVYGPRLADDARNWLMKYYAVWYLVLSEPFPSSEIMARAFAYDTIPLYSDLQATMKKLWEAKEQFVTDRWFADRTKDQLKQSSDDVLAFLAAVPNSGKPLIQNALLRLSNRLENPKRAAYAIGALKQQMGELKKEHAELKRQLKTRQLESEEIEAMKIAQLLEAKQREKGLLSIDVPSEASSVAVTPTPTPTPTPASRPSWRERIVPG
jgi:hypothetical protein